MTEVVPDAALRKSVVRLLPYLFLLYVVAYLDRVNVGFAQLQLQQDLKFSKTTYGFGAGIFFVGYFLLRCQAISSWSGSERGVGLRASW